MIERKIGNWTLRGRSVGGFGTSIHIKELGVALDMGFFIPETLRGDHLFLSPGTRIISARWSPGWGRVGSWG